MTAPSSDSQQDWFDAWRRTNWKNLREVCDSALTEVPSIQGEVTNGGPERIVEIIQKDLGTLGHLSKETRRLEKEYDQLSELTGGAESENVYPSPNPSEDSSSSSVSADDEVPSRPKSHITHDKVISSEKEDAKAAPVIAQLRKKSAFLKGTVTRLRSDADELETHSNNLSQRADAIYRGTPSGAKQYAEEVQKRKDKERERRRNIGRRINAEKARLDQAKREAAADEARWEAEQESVPDGRRRHSRHSTHHHHPRTSHKRETPPPSPPSDTGATPSPPSGNIPHIWEEYEKAWDNLTHSKPGIQPLYTFKTFPWPVEPPPSVPSEIKAENISAFLLSRRHSGSKSQRERLHSALLKWHPDRASRWVHLVVESERDDVEKGAAVVIRCLNQLMEKASNTPASPSWAPM
ncbi:hypothetical protein FRC03_002060 [Tulasnella sp. 419]|nr:hypothetical protein FRC03_002060 [Tulasnella sp. 419]